MRTTSSVQVLATLGILTAKSYADSHQLTGARPVLDAYPLVATSDIELPTPSITVDHSSPFFQGKTYHYNATYPHTGERDEFSISIIVHDTTVNASAKLLQDAITTDLIYQAPSDKERLPDWVCEYGYGCAEAITYSASISLHQTVAAVQMIDKLMRADSAYFYRLLLIETPINFAINIGSWYITNAIQMQTPQAADSCSSGSLENLVLQLQADIVDLTRQIQSGNSRSRTYDHWANNRAAQVEGRHLKHGVKPTLNPYDMQEINC
jgi:hypothetical protein